MLYFRDYRWLRVNGSSRFSVYIPSGARERSQIQWRLDLHYVAGGVAWRRVDFTKRPRFWMELNGFTPPANSWRDLEQVSFRNREEEDRKGDARTVGWLHADLYSQDEAQDHERIMIGDFEWRVAARDGRWFTIELAALCGSQRSFADLAREQPVAVTADGEVVEEDERLAASEFWRKNSDLYLLEQVPFGTVIVRTPRNARDPFRYAFTRAQELIGGLPEPYDSEILRMGKPRPDKLSLYDDLHVELHFFGYYED